jgi:hypothetical protein
MCAARLDIWSKENAGAPGQAGNERRRITESQGIGQGVFGLIEIANRCAGKVERFSPGNAGLIRSIGHATILAGVFQPRVDLELVIEVVDDFSVNAGATFEPGSWNEAVVQLRPIDAVKLSRLMEKIDEAERHDIYTGRAPVKVLVKEEIDVGLFEFYRASQLVICFVGDAAVLELNLCIEDDVIGDLIRRH